MSAILTDSQLAKVVIYVVKAFHPGKTGIDKDTKLDNDLGDDRIANRRYWRPIDDILEHHGSDLHGKPGDLMGCNTVGDIIVIVIANAS